MRELKKINVFLVFFVAALGWASLCGAQDKKSMVIMGWVEMARLSSDGPYIKAKLDTGALTSSLHAGNIVFFKKRGQRMVRFTLDVKCARSGERTEITLEKPLERKVRIRRHESEAMRRPVVTLDFCLGGKIYSTQFSLTNRSNFNYPMLLGRRFIKNRILVDSGHTFLRSQVCPER